MKIEHGLHLGYRKASAGGIWLMKRELVVPSDEQHPKPWRRRPETWLGVADDVRDADGVEVLDFGQAQRKAMDLAVEHTLRAGGKLYSVADAVADYLDLQESHRKGAADARIKLKAYVLPKLGHKLVEGTYPAGSRGLD